MCACVHVCKCACAQVCMCASVHVWDCGSPAESGCRCALCASGISREEAKKQRRKKEDAKKQRRKKTQAHPPAYSARQAHPLTPLLSPLSFLLPQSFIHVDANKLLFRGHFYENDVGYFGETSVRINLVSF